jgi:ribonuclease inhibitor
MKTIVLDGLYMNTRETTHTYLAWRLGLPSYYGRNLDALHDVLTDPCEPTQIILYRKDRMLESLGEYGEQLLTVFRDAAAESPTLRFAEDER